MKMKVILWKGETVIPANLTNSEFAEPGDVLISSKYKKAFLNYLFIASSSLKDSFFLIY